MYIHTCTYIYSYIHYNSTYTHTYITYSNITLGQPQVSTRFLVESNDNDGCNQLKFEVCSDIAMGIY